MPPSILLDKSRRIGYRRVDECDRGSPPQRGRSSGESGCPQGPALPPAQPRRIAAASRAAAAGDRESPRSISRTRKADRGCRKTNLRSGATTGGAEKKFDQLLQTAFFRRIGWSTAAARPQAQEQAETGRPAWAPWTSSTIGSHHRGEHH